MTEIRRFFGAVHAASPRLSTAWWTLVVLRGLLPAAFAVGMGVLVAAIDGRRAARARPRRRRRSCSSPCRSPGPFHDAVSANLGATTSSWLHERLLEACDGAPGLAHLESPSWPPSCRRRGTSTSAWPVRTSPSPCRTSAAGSPPSPPAGPRSLLLSGYGGGRRSSSAGRGCRPTTSSRPAAIWHARTDDGRHGAAAPRRLRLPARRVRTGGQGGAPLRSAPTGSSAGSRRCAASCSTGRGRIGACACRPTWWAVVLVDRGERRLLLARSPPTPAPRVVDVGALVVFAQAAIGASTLAFGEVDWWLRVSAPSRCRSCSTSPTEMAAGWARLDRGATARPPACRSARSASRASVRLPRHRAGRCSTGST